MNDQTMQIYVVGGYVRDWLLGKQPKDMDFVVVHATEEQLMHFGEVCDLTFKRVGADFPVFLDQHGREWALARRERKTGPGYHGFAVEFDPTVTIEEDLMRRDLTINAMARRVYFVLANGQVTEECIENEIIDPYGGRHDLDCEILRHVSDAFAEDPVRVLRLVRFVARLCFDVAEDTYNLIQQMCDAGELNHLQPERVWAETEKALAEEYPALYFLELGYTDALNIVFPTLANNQVFTREVKSALNTGDDLLERIGVIVSQFRTLSDAQHFCFNELMMPKAVAEFATKYKRFLDAIPGIVDSEFNPERISDLFVSWDLYRDKKFMATAHRTTMNFVDDEKLNDVVFKLLRLYSKAHGYGFDDLSDEQKESLSGPEIGQAINDLRKEVITQALKEA